MLNGMRLMVHPKFLPKHEREFVCLQAYIEFPDMSSFQSKISLYHFGILLFMALSNMHPVMAQTPADSLPTVQSAGKRDTGKIFAVVEQMPEFPGGMAALNAYIVRNIKYPEAAREENREGKVFVKFVVDTAGFITQVSVSKTSGYEDLDREAFRVVRSMPPWTPGKMNGKPVKVVFNLPIRFKLSE